MAAAHDGTDAAGRRWQGEFREIAQDSPAYAEALALRDTILRAPLGLRYSDDDIAAERDATHVVGCARGEIVAYGQLRAAAEPGWLQMKQVAVRADVQGTGAGRALVGHLEQIARARSAVGIVLHARESAAGFYELLGYLRDGEEFTEVGIPHCRMRNHLAG